MEVVRSLAQTLAEEQNRNRDAAAELARINAEFGRKKENDITTAISTHINTVWDGVKQDNKNVRKHTIELFRRSRGEYSPEKLAAIKAFKGSETFLRMGENKCRAAFSWITDIYRGDTDLPWDIEPTAKPDLPDIDKKQIEQEILQEGMRLQREAVLVAQQTGTPVDARRIAQQMNELQDIAHRKAAERLMDEAKKRCKEAAIKIRDDNQEGGWAEAFKNFLWYFIRCQAGIIRGPLLKKVRKDSWQPDGVGGFSLVAEEIDALDVYAVSPFNFFPSRNMTNVNDGDIIEVHELTRQALSDLMNVPGYSKTEIQAVLAKLHNGAMKPRWLTIDDETAVNQIEKEKNIAIGTPPTHTAYAQNQKHQKIQALEFSGSASGYMMIEWMQKSDLPITGIVPEAEYQVNCWKIGDHVIKAVVNPDVLGRKNYHVTSWAKNPNWILGEGLLEFAAPIEDILNAIARALSNNIAIASGPQVEINKDMCDDKSPIYPWKRWETSNMQMKDGKAVNFWQPDMHCEELMRAFEFFARLLDEITVPAYAQGASQSGVTAGTATVFTQLLAAASRSIKAVVANIDDDVIAPYIQMCYDLLMKAPGDIHAKGDAKVVAKGVSGLLAKEQQAQRKVEYLQVVANPTFAQVLGAKNIGYILSEIAKSNNLNLPDGDRLAGTPSLEELLTKINMATSGLDARQATGQIGAGGTPQNPQATTMDGRPAGAPEFQQPAQIAQ